MSASRSITRCCNREAEYELVPLSVDEQVGILVWSPLAGGLLSGKYGRDRTAPAGSRHTTEWSEPPIYDQDKMYAIIEALVEVAREHGHSPAQTALAYLLAKPAVTSVVVGARSASSWTTTWRRRRGPSTRGLASASTR